MRELKFRARDLDGDFVFGCLAGNNKLIVDNSKQVIPVDPKSIRQLVGYDAKSWRSLRSSSAKSSTLSATDSSSSC